jgi:hypothetical protein
LLSEFLQDGFLTNGDPVYVVQNDELTRAALEFNPGALWGDGGDTVAPFSVGYMKGKARSLTILTVMSMVTDDGVDLGQACQPSQREGT